MHILVIRPGAIGDALLAFPVMTALRERYMSHITFVSNAAVLALAQNWGVADEVHDYSEGRWSELFAHNGVREVALRALLTRTEMALCWLRDPEDIVATNMRAAGVQCVIVAPGRPAEEARQHVVSYLAATVGLHVDVNRPFMPGLRPFGGNTVEGNTVGGAWRPRGIATTMTRSVHSSGDPSRSPCFPGAFAIHPLRSPCFPGAFAVHPGSGGAHKCWPLERFAEVIVALWQRAIPVLLLAGPADHVRLERLLPLLPPPPHAELLTQLVDEPLLTLAQALQRCRGYLGNDSGITHLAALSGLPTIVLFGPTDPVMWHPIGPHVHVLRADLLANLHIEHVLCTIEKLL